MSLAAPVIRDDFSYAGDSFSVSASGHVHRRYTLPELKAHFKGTGTVKDHPAHWYEAQLLHYGLPKSKVKGTAKLRLMDAVNAGTIAVPASLTALEREMKKEWTKANKSLSKPSGNSKVGATKRKATDVQVSSTGGASVSVSVTVKHELASPSPAKKSRTTTKPAAKVPTVAAKNTPKAAPQRKPSTSAPSSSTPRKQTARRGNSNVGGRIKHEPDIKDEFGDDAHFGSSSFSASSYYDTAPAASPPPTARKQTARRARPFLSGRIRREPGLRDEFIDNPFDRLQGLPSGGFYLDEAANGFPPLGFINGRYELTFMGGSMGGSECVEAYRWLVCTIEGDRLWVSFDFGMVRGIMRRETRPWRSGREGLLFEWCGEKPDGQTLDDSHRAALAFVGGGVIEGIVEFGPWTYKFTAQRVSGQTTRSEISANQMWDEWNGRCWRN
ncbi:uncharacterized protein CTRU02_214938 [Colletotrichum truncatum]|uniref:Uncharacterized protein n=1 Tax=Colletotrichum truncatum TaxID=5467 RepID=A0ACC3YE62_COLTU|nr:uncharacterized protein CTRU02_08311 [Colletotrichum truncatum]KAF6790182.1 hypothetical protein CTRU02_08311 [Colletotrichum truncatum]